jgi:preprotein translocase subunit SecD
MIAVAGCGGGSDAGDEDRSTARPAEVQLRFYDWETNVVGLPGGDPGERALPSRAAAEQLARGTPGAIVVREEAQRGWFALRDRPALTEADIAGAEQAFDPITNFPVVRLTFTDEGERNFEDLTRRVAGRALKQAPPGISVAEAARHSGHFAIVLDREVVVRPLVNFIENPAGLVGENGALISGSFTIKEAQDLAMALNAQR